MQLPKPLVLVDSIFDEELPIWKTFFPNAKEFSNKSYNDLEFAPIIIRGGFSTNSIIATALRAEKVPNLIWPFRLDSHHYRYTYPTGFARWKMLNSDVSGDSTGSDILQMFDVNERLWIRSNSGNKQFTGGLFTKDEFLTELEYMKSHGGEIPFVAASPKKFSNEVRHILIDGKVVSSSTYSPDDPDNVSLVISNERNAFAEDFIRCTPLNPDIVVDTCEYKGEIKLVEINNLLTSGWYASDIEKIIETISKKFSK